MPPDSGSPFLAMKSEVVLGLPGSNLSVMELGPPSMAHDERIMSAVGVYFLIFLTGLAGHTVFLTHSLFINERLKGPAHAVAPSILLLGSVFVDGMVLATVPMLVAELMLGHWIFGNVLCKAYWYAESMGKIGSPLLMGLLTLAVHRELRATQPPTPAALKLTKRLAVMTTLGAVGLASALLLPLPLLAHSSVASATNPIPAPSAGLSGPEDRFVRLVRIHCDIPRGNDSRAIFPNFSSSSYNWSIFVLGQVLLPVLVIVCTVELGRGLGKRPAGERRRARKLLAWNAANALLYAASFTPFWLATLGPETMEMIRLWVGDFVLVACHVFPYAYFGFAWLLLFPLDRAFAQGAGDDGGGRRPPRRRRNSAMEPGEAAWAICPPAQL